MRVLKRLFGKLTGNGMRKYCSCGHTVSANLAFCPHCGRRLTDDEECPND